jgi:YVTN family beta-propeller protein
MISKQLPNVLKLVPATILGLTTALAAAQQPYKVIDHWKVGGTGGWDYLLADSDAGVIYVTHGPRVEVISATTGKPVGAITGLKGTHGIALDPDGKRGYISDGGANAVIVFDRKNFSTLASIPTGTNPDGLAYEPTTKTVWAFNGRGKSASVIDTATNKVVATIPLPGKPEFPVADGRGNMYDNIEDTNQIVKIDANSKKVTATFKLTACDSPSGLAMDVAKNRLFAVCDGKKMAVIDASSGKLLASPAIGDGPDATNFSPSRNFAFSPNGEGTLSVVDAGNGYKTIETLPTAQGARTMTYDEKTDRAYVVTGKYGPRPAPTAANPHPYPSVVPDTFEVIVIGR